MDIDENDWEHLPRLRDAADAMVPSALLTEDEAEDYVLGALTGERLAAVEFLLARTPKYREELVAKRQQCLDYVGAPAVKPRADLLPSRLHTFNEFCTGVRETLSGLLEQAVTAISPRPHFGFSTTPRDGVDFQEGEYVLRIAPDRSTGEVRIIVETEHAELSGSRVAFIWPGGARHTEAVLALPANDALVRTELRLTEKESREALANGFEIRLLPPLP